MKGISGGLGSVDAAVTPCELSQKVFRRDKERSHLEVCRQIRGSVYLGCGTWCLLADWLLVCLINMLQLRMCFQRGLDEECAKDTSEVWC